MNFSGMSLKISGQDPWGGFSIYMTEEYYLEHKKALVFFFKKF